MKSPQFDLSRSGNTITLDILNRDGEDVLIHRALSQAQELSAVSVINADQFIDTQSGDVCYAIQLLGEAVNITEDNSASSPPHYVAEPVGDVTFTMTSFTFNPVWGASVEVDTITLNQIPATKKSIRKYTTI